MGEASSSKAVGTEQSWGGWESRGSRFHAALLRLSKALCLVFVILLSYASMYAQQRQASTVLVLRITTAARVSMPALLTFSEPPESPWAPQFVARGSIQVEARLDKETSNETILAEWKPATDQYGGGCVGPASTVADAGGTPGEGVRSSSHSQAAQLEIRSRWSQREDEGLQVASLNLSGLGAVSRNIAAPDRAPGPGARLSPRRNMAPGSAASLAQIPATLHPRFGLELEFSMPHAPFAVPPAGVVTITYVAI